MFHQPSRLMFQIYRDPLATSTRPSIYDLRARLVHVCDGTTVPAAKLAEIGASAAYAFSLMAESVDFIEYETDDDQIPF